MILGTFGKLQSREHPHRGSVGNENTAFITVGKMDNPNLGWGKGKNYQQIFREWRKLSYTEMKNVLLYQLQDEKEFTAAKVELWRKANPDKSLCVEIANEPNLFPYIPPELYAWYYSKWYNYLKKLDPAVRIMNGGLWIYEGLPASILRLGPMLGIDCVSTGDYYNTFLWNLPKNKEPDIFNLHFYPWGGGYGSAARSLKDLVLAYGKSKWITEYGNINPLDLEATKGLLKSIHRAFRILSIQRAYYFKASGVDSKLLTLRDEIRRWKAGIKGVEYLLTLISRRPFRWISNFLPRLFGCITAKDGLELIRLAEQYEKQLPIQGLETDGKLNELGKAYFEDIK